MTAAVYRVDGGRAEEGKERDTNAVRSFNRVSMYE